MSVNELIETIDFDLPFDELSDEQVANYLSIRKIPYLARTGFMANYEKVADKYEADQMIVSHRGKENLHLYL